MRRLFLYSLDYKCNQTGAYKTLEFKAPNDAEAQLYAESFCNHGWHKYYGMVRLGGAK